MSISIRKRLPGMIEKIVSNKVVSEVVIRTAAGVVTSIITTGSAKGMNLKEGDYVFAVMKAIRYRSKRNSRQFWCLMSSAAAA
jgi:molybdopterin-binding protein